MVTFESIRTIQKQYLKIIKILLQNKLLSKNRATFHHHIIFIVHAKTIGNQNAPDAISSTSLAEGKQCFFSRNH